LIDIILDYIYTMAANKKSQDASLENNANSAARIALIASHLQGIIYLNV